MHRLQEIIRLHRMETSGRTIAAQLRMGRETVRSHLEAFERAGVLEGDPSELPELSTLRAIVCEQLGRPAPAQQVSSLEGWRSEIAAQHKKGAGPTAIHDYLRLRHQSDYTGSLSAVKRMCQRLHREQGPVATDVAIPVETASGQVNSLVRPAIRWMPNGSKKRLPTYKNSWRSTTMYCGGRGNASFFA